MDEIDVLKETVRKLELEILEERKKTMDMEKQVVRSENKAVSYREMNELVNQFPSLAERKAEMDYYIAMARQFSASKAFKDYTPEQCYVMMKAGQEMGLQEVEAMQSLYIVNGSVKFYGDKMISRLTKQGYKIEYLDETPSQVTVRVSKDNEIFTETARADDQIMQNSKAAKFALKNKLRFHGVRMIASFHLPHLYGSVADEFSSDFTQYEIVENVKAAESINKKVSNVVDEEKNELLESISKEIQDANSRDDLKVIMKKHSSIMATNKKLMEQIASKKESLEEYVG